MKHLLAILLFACLALPVQAETLFVFDDENARISLNDRPCDDAVILALILPQYQSLFQKFTMLIKDKEMIKKAGGFSIVEGCWSDNFEIVPRGLVAFINQFGGYGYVPLDEFSAIKPGVDVRVQ